MNINTIYRKNNNFPLKAAAKFILNTYLFFLQLVKSELASNDSCEQNKLELLITYVP